MNSILIVSSSVESHSYGPVCQYLDNHSFPYVLFLTDRVLSGEERFCLSLAEDGSTSAHYEGRNISPETVAAGWLWKMSSFRAPGAERNVSRQLTLVNEVTQMHNAIWSVYSDNLWLNSPASVWKAERKLAQLLVARAVGFDIPWTLVGSHWEDVGDPLTKNGAFIVKMARGVLADQNHIRAMGTTRIDKLQLRGLRQQAVAFPGIYQPFVEKAREWRVTVVGENVFPAAIYTEGEAKTDWRQHQLTSTVSFRREPLPNEVSERCVGFLRSMSLTYGAFDLIEQPDGRIVFLECNPSGQFSWLEEQLGLPISRAIANELMTRAEQGQQHQKHLP